jgi:hypothetical protein
MDSLSPKITEHVQQLYMLNLPHQQKKYYQDFLQKGQSFLYRKENPTLEKFCRINNAKIKECYRNSLLLAMACENIEYVEGYMSVADIPFPIEHAWNYEPNSNDIIDTTAHVAKFKFDTIEYFGVIIPKEVLEEYIEKETYKTALQYYLTRKA